MKPSSEVEQAVLHSGLTPSHLSVSVSSIYFLMSMYTPPPLPTPVVLALLLRAGLSLKQMLTDWLS